MMSHLHSFDIGVRAQQFERMIVTRDAYRAIRATARQLDGDPRIRGSGARHFLQTKRF